MQKVCTALRISFIVLCNSCIASIRVYTASNNSCTPLRNSCRASIISYCVDKIPNKKTLFRKKQGFQKKGDDILSHITAVPSAQAGLTSLFGMGRGEPRRNNHLRFLVVGSWFWVIGVSINYQPSTVNRSCASKYLNILR